MSSIHTAWQEQILVFIAQNTARPPQNRRKKQLGKKKKVAGENIEERV
jgi:hypothetical protein